MTLGDIIELWMKHTNYDPDRKSFYLGSTDAVADIDHIYTSQSSTARLMTG